MIQLRPIGSYLTKFDSGKAEIDSIPAIAETAPMFDLDAHMPSSEDLLAEEREKAREEVRAELERDYEVKLEDERQAFEKEREAFDQRLEALRATWMEEEGARIAQVIHQDIESCFENIRGALAHILTPFLTQNALTRSLDDFIEAVRSAALDQTNPLVELQGPPDLLEVARERLSQEQISLRTIETNSLDIAARINSTLIETRMEEWVRRLRNGE
ncbi:hypothetical protein MJC1_02413 [Methylocystis sp. MJC1]|nr:hypothetical protein MJC1_02413 [Methylocystis sp. MJC1]